MKTTDIIVAGVGGQGSILASHILADAAIRGGVQGRVRVGETFGAAMRGGAVASHVRIGEVYGPLVKEREADVILALEPLEGFRVGVKYLSKEGIVVMNRVPIMPVDVNTGQVEYPSLETIKESMEEIGESVFILDAQALAIEAGHPRTLNIVMLGALYATGRLPIGREAFLETIKDRVPPKTVEVNMRAFELGEKQVQ